LASWGKFVIVVNPDGYRTSMQPIARWLKTLGLGRYAQLFAENEIDISVLRYLTDQDLKDLGVPLGHRRKILGAIGEIGRVVPPPPEHVVIDANPPSIATGRAAPVAPLAQSMPPVASQIEAANVGERRHVVVMFCDLVGSTGIATQLDPEEWRDLVGAYIDLASAAILQMGGRVASKLGDGLMALFGYPIAQENDAERAVRAALSIHRALVDLNRKNTGLRTPTLVARIAIDTGPVVVNATGEIFGDVPNIAARAQALAASGAVVVTARMQRQVAGLFIAEELGSHQFKGVPEPVILFRIVRASGGGRRAGQRNLTPLAGRQEEVAVLMRHWERARLGDGQLMLIVGEPGIGKSRLVEEFHDRLRDVPHTWVEWTCSQLLQNTPLHPIAEWGRIRFGSSDVPDERRLADLENSLAQVKLDPVENAALLAPLIDISLPPERASTLTAQELRRRQLASVNAWVMAGARVQPMVLAVEDLQWADPTTLDLLGSIAELGALTPLFFLATARLEFRPQWLRQPHHAIISLAPLDRPQVRRMVGGLVARHTPSNDLVQTVADRSGGVPLFVEEVTRLLLEHHEQDRAPSIPPTLQQSLAARLDRLGQAREVAQIGAVIGHDFSYALLHAVAGMDDSILQSALDRLAAANLLIVRGLPPNSDYRFKHALIQDAAYENLLKSRRQVLHLRVAEALRGDTDGAAVEPELLAHHFSQAGLTEAAIEWWGKAGQRSLERSALVEATAHLNRALAQIEVLSSTPELRRERITLQVALANALMHTKGYAAPETKASLEQARALIEQAEALGDDLDDPLLLFSVLFGFWIASYAAFNGDAVCHLAAQFLALAEKQRAPAPLMIGHRIMGIALVETGEIQAGRTHLDRALALYQPDRHRALATRFGQDSRVSILVFLSHALWFLGYPETAGTNADLAVKRAREINPAMLMYAQGFTIFPHLWSGNYAAVETLLDELTALAAETGGAQWELAGLTLRGCVLACTGKPSNSVQILTSAIPKYRAAGTTLGIPSYLSYLAKAHAELGQIDDARRCIAEAITLVEKTKESWCEAEIHRVAGEITLLSPHPDDRKKAEAHFERALLVARAQQAKSWELRAAMSMARLRRDQGKREEARDVLVPLYGWFTEGFDTIDLQEARILLGHLAA
jgi:class 3 adenylate cyclase/predicted ATPase